VEDSEDDDEELELFQNNPTQKKQARQITGQKTNSTVGSNSDDGEESEKK
jgi:hypothetical protein